MDYSKESVAARIKNQFSKIVVLDEVDSTNTYIKQNADSLPDRSLVFAKKQTAGRGRRGKSFCSPETGLYFSVFLKEGISISDPSLFTTSAAVAVCDAISSLCGIEASIKWVNDIYISQKKICGILAESLFLSPSTNAVIVGFGINLYTPDNGFPDEIKSIAASISDFTKVPDAALLAAKIYDEFISYHPFGNNDAFIGSYKKRSCVIGKDVILIRNQEKTRARALDILNDASLLVEYEDKSREIVLSGDLSLALN